MDKKNPYSKIDDEFFTDDDGVSELEKKLSNDTKSPSKPQSNVQQTSSKSAVTAPKETKPNNPVPNTASYIPINSSEAPVNTTVPLESTLEEPVKVTIKRDLMNIWTKIKVVLFPKKQGNILRDWDLWGPLLLCLVLATLLSLSSHSEDKSLIFAGVFFIVWIGSLFVTLNFKLLGEKISFFQSICVLGYCIFPLTIATIICIFIDIFWLKGIIVAIFCYWSSFASLKFLSVTKYPKRKALALYPMFLFYFLLSWIIWFSAINP
jgi:hypothetical protein